TQFTKLATSNSVGVALISLDGSQTANIASIQSIGVSIAEDVGFLPVEVIMPVEDFPTIAPGEPDLITKALEFLGANWGYIVVVIIVASAIVVVLFWYRKQQGIRINQINDSIKIATEELAAVKSIQSIIIQTSTKLTIYEENVVEDAMNTNLIGGMITAFSSFLNEIGRSELFGWEMMEREDVSLAVHKGKYSNFIVISTGKLPMIILSQIQDAQKALEDSFKDNFVNTARGVKKLIKSQVHPQFTKASFKIPLTRTLKLNTGNINKVMKEKSVSRALKQTVILLNDLSESQYSTDGLFDLEKLSAFFESHSISSKLSSRTIMLAYEFHIIEVVSED
ncbi:MAG: hypothetical protein GPJ54_08185, partial [Candidatus Heimdallarchaeota archaeon]|nr:hypothetical protein [Candidatus Heimdallarchaeota archaeon]